MRYKVILFDIDGTLLRAGGAGRAALARSLEELHGIEQADTNLAFGGRTDLSITRELFARHGLSWTTLRAWDLLDCYAEHLAQELRRQPSTLLSGVSVLLEAMAAAYPHGIGLLTGNILRCARLKLRGFDLWSRFSFGGFGDHHESRLEIAVHAWEQAKVHLPFPFAAHEVLIIGDAPADIHCARHIGAHVMAVGTGPIDIQSLAAERPDYLLEDLGNTAAVLDILRSPA